MPNATRFPNRDRLFKCGVCGKSKPRSESGAHMCMACFDTRSEMLKALRACDEAFAMWQVGAIPGRPEDILRLIQMVRNAIAKATAL